MAQNDVARAQLEQQLARLMKRVVTIGADLRQTHDRDWTQQAIEQENDEVLEGLDAMSRSEVLRIRAALGRIANGTYGACSVCGGPIGAERLTAIPSTTTCVDCASA